MKKLITKISCLVGVMVLFGTIVQGVEDPVENSVPENTPAASIHKPKPEYNPPLLQQRRAVPVMRSAAAAAEYTGNSYTYWAQNNKMRLYFNVDYSDTWYFRYNETDEAETSYRENFAIWFDNQIHYGFYGYRYSPVKLFGGEKNDPDNSCILNILDKIYIERSIQIAPGDGTYFKICYKLTNVTDQPIEDVRFFELVDFDIPHTGAHGDDIGWYDPATDFVWVKDEAYFQNGFTGNRKSAHHSVNNYSYVIEGDANDGNLDDNDTQNQNDPGIGLQWNAGTLQPGQTWDLDVTFWFGQPNNLFAVAGPDRTVHEGQQIQFDASDSRVTEGKIVSYDWDFDGDGEFDDASGMTPVYTYNTVGVYNAVLRVIDSNDNQAYDECKITVLPAMFKNVNVQSFVPLTGLLIDPNSITGSPFTIVEENGESKIQWNVGSMNVGDHKSLSFEVEVLDPILGERRMIERDNITNYLDNLANAMQESGTSVEPTPVQLQLGPSFVDVTSGFGISVTADKEEYTSPETATFATGVSLPEYTGEQMVTTQNEFNAWCAGQCRHGDRAGFGAPGERRRGQLLRERAGLLRRAGAFQREMAEGLLRRAEILRSRHFGEDPQRGHPRRSG